MSLGSLLTDILCIVFLPVFLMQIHRCEECSFNSHAEVSGIDISNSHLHQSILIRRRFIPRQHQSKQRRSKAIRLKKKRGQSRMTDLFLGDPLGVRTQDPHIKSVMLYRLS